MNTRKALTALVLLAAPLQAQVIAVRPLPMSQSDQFDFFPSRNMGMGGLSIALADTLLDPFRNPAAASRAGSRLFASPAIYTVSNDAGEGRTLPAGLFFSAGRWFGGGAIAIQEVDASRPSTFFGPVFVATPQPGATDPVFSGPGIPGIVEPGASSHGNFFGTAMAGRRFGTLAVAASVRIAGLRALDGQDMMYDGAQRVDQDGSVFDARVGIEHHLGDKRSFQAVLLYDRSSMRRAVYFVENFWDPATQSTLQRTRAAGDGDGTSTWGAHAAWSAPLGTAGWQAGVTATANRIRHRGEARYTMTALPFQPGWSNAFNIGVGLSKKDGDATFGVELVHEPIWSRRSTAAGESRFTFSNFLGRAGVERAFDFGGRKALTMQMGLVVNVIRYHLGRTDYADGARSRQNASWAEWTPTWGLAFAFPEFELRYRGSATNGSGRPQVNAFGGGCPVCAREAFTDMNGMANLAPVAVTSHQFSFAIPLGRTSRTGGAR